jgi:hypothetical protein
MSFASWPAGTFNWLAQFCSAANRLALFSESQSITDLICTVAPHYQGRALLDATRLFHQGRFQEAAEKLAESVRGDPNNTFKQYLLYACLREVGDPEWMHYAELVAESTGHDLQPVARADLGLGAIERSNAEASTSQNDSFRFEHALLVRV